MTAVRLNWVTLFPKMLLFGLIAEQPVPCGMPTIASLLKDH